jgi:hypothetical protein
VAFNDLELPRVEFEENQRECLSEMFETSLHFGVCGVECSGANRADPFMLVPPIFFTKYPRSREMAPYISQAAEYRGSLFAQRWVAEPPKVQQGRGSHSYTLPICNGYSTSSRIENFVRASSGFSTPLSRFPLVKHWLNARPPIPDASDLIMPTQRLMHAERVIILNRHG